MNSFLNQITVVSQPDYGDYATGLRQLGNSSTALIQLIYGIAN